MQAASFLAKKLKIKIYLDFLAIFMEIAADTCSACSIFYPMRLNFLCLLRKLKS